MSLKTKFIVSVTAVIVLAVIAIVGRLMVSNANLKAELAEEKQAHTVTKADLGKAQTSINLLNDSEQKKEAAITGLQEQVSDCQRLGAELERGQLERATILAKAKPGPVKHVGQPVKQTDKQTSGVDDETRRAVAARLNRAF